MRKLLKNIFRTTKTGATFNFIVNKYYNIWMNRFVIPELDYQMNNYIFRKLYADGTIAGFIAKGTEGSDEYPQGLPVFCPYAVSTINLYDYPIDVTLVNTKGVSFIPSTLQKVDQDVVIGWCQSNRKSVKQIVEYYAEKIDIVEAVIKCNLNAHRMPFLITTNPEDQKAIEELFDSIIQGDSALYVPSEFSEKVKVLTSGAQYIIDKLCDYKKALEDDLREILGCDNLGVKNKKEHLISMEVEANDDVTEDSKNVFYDEIQQFCNRFSETFGFKIHLEERHQDYYEEDEKVNKEDKDEDSDEEIL